MDTDKKISPPDINMPEPLSNYQLEAGNELRVNTI